MWEKIFIGVIITVIGGTILALILWYVKKQWGVWFKKPSAYEGKSLDEIKKMRKF